VCTEAAILSGLPWCLACFGARPIPSVSNRSPSEGPPTLAKTHDAHSLGASVHNIDAIQRCHRPPTFASGGLSGYTYVVLGSTLGAKIIVRQLRAVLGPAASFRFYGGEDGLYQAAWSAFRSDLEESGEKDLEPIPGLEAR
jgi:hypothetical protein